MKYKEAKEILESGDGRCPQCRMGLEIIGEKLDNNYWINCPDYNCDFDMMCD